MEYIDNLVTWISTLGNTSCLYIFIILIACGFGLPMSKDGLIIAAGILAGIQKGDPYLSYSYMLITCFVGILIGDSITFFLGRFFGPKIQRFKILRKLFSPRRFTTIQKLFKKYGIGMIIFARFVPMIRGPIYLFCGMSRRIKVSVFEIVNGTCTLIYAGLLLWVGFTCAQKRHEIISFIDNYQKAIITVTITLSISVLLLLIKKKLKKISPSKR